ncbi:MAG: Ig-like domain-containing protein, partial [Angelakisella sp.]
KRVAVLTASAVAFSMILAAFTPAFALPQDGADTPFVATFAKSLPLGQTVTFTGEDFTSRVSGDDPLSAIVVASLPQNGILRLAGRELIGGETVDRAALGTLCFVPEALETAVHTSFNFIPVFEKAGVSQEPVSVFINVSEDKNYAPISHNLSFDTYAGTKLSGRFIVTDTESDPCTFRIASAPEKGDVTISEAGFCYLPEGGKTGKDSFTYIATDSFGNSSKEGKVSINISKKPKGVTTYTDMDDSPAHFAASKLAESGIFVGECIGSETFLYPAKAVSRAEFVAMVAALTDMAMPTVAVGTGLSDNETIPTWAQPYVAAAVNCGVVYGENIDGNKIFRATDAISRAEAASILDRAIKLTNDGRTAGFADGESIPSWAAQPII